MRILITGATGFVGRYLIPQLLQQGKHEVWGFCRWRSQLQGFEKLPARFHWKECDIRDAGSVMRAVRAIRPERIYHLAAQSYVPTSWHAPSETLINNIVGQLHILDAVRDLEKPCRVLIVGSSEEYGLVSPHDLPVKESTPFRPLSPYAVSKVGQDMLAYQYHRSYGMPIIRTRAFNHDGPGRPDVFVASGLAKQVARVSLGLQEPVLTVGNMAVVRDFLDVRDVVRAYALAMEKGIPGEVYNICSGRGWSVKQIVDFLCKTSGIRARIHVDPARARPADNPRIIGDGTKFRLQTGWKPQIPFETTLMDLLKYWQTRVFKADENSPSQ